jgi:hypothetical protein
MCIRDSNIYTWTKFENSTCTGSGRSGLVNCTSESGKNRWNSIFNLPSTADGSSPLMTDLITGQVTALTAIGQDELAKKLSKRDEERTYLKQWLSSANSQTSCPGPSPMSGQIFDENADADSTPTFVTIDEKYLNSNLGLGEGDFYQIFGCILGGSGAVFAHIGGKRLYEAVKNSPEALDEKNQFLAEHPEILQLIQEVDFYKTRVDDIKKHLDILDGLMGNLKNDPETKETYQTYTNIRDKVRNHSGTSVKAYTELAKEAKTQFGILRTKAATSDKFKTIINSSLSEIDAIFFDIEEIITGEDNGRLSDFRFSELTINDTGSTGTATSHSNMNPRRAVWLLLTGKASIKDVIVYLGGGMVEDNLNLPPNTFIYYIKSLEQANQDKPEQVNAWDGSDHINYDIGDGSTATFESSYFNSLGGSTADQTNKKYERERFMASLGQAAIEEQMALLPNSFQGTSAPDPGKNETISDVIGNMASASGSSASKAKSALQSGFGTSASLDRLISGDTSAWSQARQSFVSFDSRLNLKSGSTEAFITGINKHMTASAYLSQEEIDLISGRLDIPESALIKLTKVLAGEESWEVNPLNFNNFNPYDQTGSLVDDSGNCIATTDGNIIYTDLDGKHTFTTQEQALNYFNDHRDRQLDYIGQIAKAFAKISGATNLGEAMFTALLKAYLSDFDNPRALSDQQIAIFAESGGISSEILSRLFVREDKKSSLFKYLVSVGEKVSELRLRYLLLDNFGVNVGGMKLTGNDLFDLLNGGGSTTLYRIAGNYMDTELGLNSGTFAKILSAPNSQVRQCLLQQAGASLIFNRLGISGLQLYGNPYHALGSSKIETVLGFPRGSFDSDSPNNNEDKRTGMIELINKVGVNAFVKAFKIPLAGLDFRPIAKQLFPLDKEADLDKLTNNQILDRLDLLLSSASLEDTNIFTARKQLTDKVVNRLQFIIDPNSVIWQYKEENGAQTAGGALRLNDFVLYESSPVWGSVAQGMVFKKEILAFQKQVAYLDFAVGIPSGRTQALLQGTITPDSYRDYISQTQATILGAGKIAEMLGIDPAKFQAVSAIYDKFRTTGNLWNDWKPEDQLLFYKAFMTVFELNLDELAGFRANTFESIILQPDNARNILLKEGLYRLDQSVFGSDSGFSTEAIFAAYLGEDGNGVYKQCNISTSSINSSLGLNGLMAKCQPVKVSGKEGGIYAASYQMANYLEKLACPDGTSGACWLRSGNTSIANVSDLLSDFLRSGDVDVLEALANASLASKINNLLNDTVALPLNFQVTWQDIVGAIYGNRDLEGVAADRAAYQALLDMNNPTATADSEPVDSYERNNGFGVTGQLNIGDPDHPYSGFVSQTSNPDDIGQMVAYNINSAYPNFDQNAYNTMVSQLESSKPQLSGSYIDAHGNPNESYFFAYDAWSRKKQAIEDAKSQARDQVRRSYQKNLEYHYFDSILYQKDKNIPPGFTAAIFEGNSHTRANALYAWVRNGIIQGGFLGLTIDAELQPLLTYMVDDAQWGNTIAFENFVKSGQIGKLDDLLRTRFDEALGVSLAPGTFTAIIAGWRNNGNFKNDYTFIGSDGKTNYTLPSLETVYKKEFASRISEWFDKQLGLSAGTSYSIYKSYKSYEAARHAFQSASVASGYLDDALAEAKRTLSGLEPGTPAATTAQENVNKLQAESDKAKTNLSSKQTQMVQMKAELISFVISTLFAKQLAALEESLGLVPGSGAMLVSMAVNWYFGLGIGPWAIGMFIVLNLFGYYKTELLCTADGYYPGAETPSSSDIVDNGGLGVFDGMNSNTKKAEYVKAAQYKARTLLGDVLSMPRVFNDQRMTPSQIMTGRKEDVDYWYPKTLDVIYQYTGAPDENGEIPSRAGLWQNPQTTAYTHIGF